MTPTVCATEMAYLDDIPKYAFGTAFEIFRDSSEPGCGTSASTDNNNLSPATMGGPISETRLRELILAAIRLGCRHFDCAPLYRTQHVVGSALREAIKSPTLTATATSTSTTTTTSSCHSSLSVPRQQFFVTSKLPPNMMRGENILRSVKRTLSELQLTYLDLFLIHAPFSTKHITDDDHYPLDEEGNLLLDDQDDGLLEKAWLKLAELKRKGYTRYIGLSNVNLEQLIRLNKLHQVDVVQNEYHIYNQDREIFDYCEEIDVHYEAYAAFGSPMKAKRDNRPCCLHDPEVNRVARLNNLTIAQVNIQWIHQQPLSYVIRCDTVGQLEENLRAIHYKSVSMNHMIDLDSLNKNIRLYWFDEHKGITRHREYPFKRANRELKEPLGEQKQPGEQLTTCGPTTLSSSSSSSLSSLSSTSTTTATTLASGALNEAALASARDHNLSQSGNSRNMNRHRQASSRAPPTTTTTPTTATNETNESSDESTIPTATSAPSTTTTTTTTTTSNDLIFNLKSDQQVTTTTTTTTTTPNEHYKKL